jgi:hypothetical protein
MAAAELLALYLALEIDIERRPRGVALLLRTCFFIAAQS